MENKILVTGGRGFLGRYVVRELLKKKENKITISSRKDISDKRVSTIVLNICNKKEVLEKVKNFDKIYHIAGNIRTENTDVPKLHYDINTQGTLNLLKACDINKISRFIFISTCEVYGKLKLNISEREETDPKNDYAKSKRFAEKYCMEYSKKFKITVIRLSYIYGLGQYSQRFFPKLIRSAVEDNRIKLSPSNEGYDYIYVKDAARGIVLLGEREQEKDFEVFNLSSGQFTKIMEIFEVVKEITGKDYEKNFSTQINNPMNKFNLNIQKAKRIGFKINYSIREGLEDFLKSYNLSKIKNNGSR